MKVRALKYLTPFIVFVTAWISFNSTGWLSFLPVLYAFGIIPFAELLLKPDPVNLEAAEEEMAKADAIYDFILYAVVLFQIPALIYFLFSMQQPDLTWVDRIGRISSMGLLCGVFGINVAHELGHRVNKAEQYMAKLLLLTSLYMHFFIEHNKGHHKNVATPADPSSARFNESLYLFWPRTIIFTYLSAWHIANDECRKKGRSVFGWYNEMVQIHFIEAALIGAITYFFGWAILGYFLIAALMGILLLETVNYIEHYGLRRKEIGEGKYERAMPEHSWNSDHVIGRVMLFELSRHSDHHYLASRKYQILRHHAHAPQMPTGYPGMMLLSLVPPLWFRVMNPRMRLAVSRNDATIV